ncbi:protein CNPPD1 [Harpegnathos saltator]|uniref:protein CNPPD1 n=1 Tax=Harpegnathos saltator TaxID=610380 RepID=UPI00058F352B|nr:protein CNPPD1 [Harpegnathos saltator]XP_011153191.1 protein CNPPD1 [Harpegnathos saltator]
MKNQHAENTPAKIQDLRSFEFLNRIKKTLYYPAVPVNNYLSLSVIERTSEFFTESSNHQLEKLDVEVASRISNAICASPCALVLAMLYIQRLKNCNSKYLQEVAPLELFLISLMVASKYLHDDGSEDEVVDAAWAIAGRITLSRTIQLEMDFLKAVNWMVSIREETFWERLRQLEKEVAYREVQKRSWCSYTELYYLMDSRQLITIASSVTLVCCTCLMAYIVCVMIMFGSTFVLQIVTLYGIWFIQMWQIVSLNETNIMSCGNSLSNALINAPYTLSDEHACSFDDYEDANDIVAKIQNESEYFVDDTNNNDNSNASWQWWLNSTMTWLIEYSDSKNLTNQVTKFDDTRSISNGARFLLHTTQNNRIRYMENFMLYCKKVLYSILNRLTTHWIGLNNLRHRIFSQSVNSIDLLVQSRRFDR